MDLNLNIDIYICTQIYMHARMCIEGVPIFFVHEKCLFGSSIKIRYKHKPNFASLWFPIDHDTLDLHLFMFELQISANLKPDV